MTDTLKHVEDVKYGKYRADTCAFSEFSLGKKMYWKWFLCGVIVTIRAIFKTLLWSLVWSGLKGIVHPKMKMCSLSDHPRCRWVCFFIRFGEMEHCITVSAMDALQWMGAVRMRVQTADKNITPHHSSPSVNILRRQKLKQRHQDILTFKPKYESIIHNSSSSEKVFRSESGEKSAQIKHRLQDKTVQNSFKQICGWILMWETTGDGLFHWRKSYYGL